MALVVRSGETTVKEPAPGDWRCMVCQDLQFARNPTCRKCGAPKPQQNAPAQSTETAIVALTPAHSKVIQDLAKGEEWQCPMCKNWTFANRSTCRTCNCPRPEGPVVTNQVEHQLQQGGYIGYLPDPTKIEAQSSWSKQFTPLVSPPLVGLPHDVAAPYLPDISTSSSSSSSSDSSNLFHKKKRRKKDNDSSDSSSSAKKKKGKKQSKKPNKDKAKAEGKPKKKAKAKKKTKPKEEAAGGGASAEADAANANVSKEGQENAKPDAEAAPGEKDKKKKKKGMDVEEELEKRRLQRERRKARQILLG